MSKRLKQAVVVLLVVFAAAQFVRPTRTNPPTDANRAIEAHIGKESGLVAVLDRACADCHSNDTVWPSFTQIAPLSWLMAYEVAAGRKALNFSEWGAYQLARRQKLLAGSCRDATTGKMPGPYVVLRPETRLSAEDIETICAASRQAEATAAVAR